MKLLGKLLCFFGFHRWGVWGPQLRFYQRGQPVRSWVRPCCRLGCHELDTRTIRV